MVKTLKYVILITLCVACVTCKKKTTITARVYNENLHEFTPNATVLLVEKHYRKRFYDPYGIGPHVSCKIISEKETDGNGTVVFDNEKLKTNQNHVYALYVKSAWGIEREYSCGDGIELGNKSELYLDDKQYGVGGFQIQINNLFSGAISGDSMTIKTTKLIYTTIHSTHIFETGFRSTLEKAYDHTPQPANILTDLYGDNGIYLLNIRKRKNGLVTSITDTFKAYPNQTRIVQINW